MCAACYCDLAPWVRGWTPARAACPERRFIRTEDSPLLPRTVNILSMHGGVLNDMRSAARPKRPAMHASISSGRHSMQRAASRRRF